MFYRVHRRSASRVIHETLDPSSVPFQDKRIYTVLAAGTIGNRSRASSRLTRLIEVSPSACRAAGEQVRRDLRGRIESSRRSRARPNIQSAAESGAGWACDATSKERDDVPDDRVRTFVTTIIRHARASSTRQPDHIYDHCAFGDDNGGTPTRSANGHQQRPLKQTFVRRPSADPSTAVGRRSSLVSYTSLLSAACR